MRREERARSRIVRSGKKVGLVFVQCFEDRVPIPLEASCLTKGLRSELFCAFVAAIVSVVLERCKLAYSCCVAEGTFS